MLAEYRNATIAVNIIYKYKIPSMTTMSSAINFGTAEMMKNETPSMIIKSRQQIINTYHSRGFRIKHILGDQQFECIRKTMELQGKDMKINGRDEHVPVVERYIRTVKERVRAIVNTLHFKILPHHLIIKIVYDTVFWLNCFRHKHSIHPTLSPCTIVTG